MKNLAQSTNKNPITYTTIQIPLMIEKKKKIKLSFNIHPHENPSLEEDSIRIIFKKTIHPFVSSPLNRNFTLETNTRPYRLPPPPPIARSRNAHIERRACSTPSANFNRVKLEETATGIRCMRTNRIDIQLTGDTRRNNNNERCKNGNTFHPVD